MRPDLLEEIIKFRGQRYPHLCAWCEHVWDISGESLYDTTLDFSDGGEDAVTPVCKLVQGQFELATGSQNNRVGKNYKRVDNGSGYWLVDCPFFKRMDDAHYSNRLISDVPPVKFLPPEFSGEAPSLDYWYGVIMNAHNAVVNGKNLDLVLEMLKTAYDTVKAAGSN